MQTVHRATSLADAQGARDVLVRSGIPAHISDEPRWVSGEEPGNDFIRVMVDNRAWDRARRAIEGWKQQLRYAHARRIDSTSGER